MTDAHRRTFPVAAALAALAAGLLAAPAAASAAAPAAFAPQERERQVPDTVHHEPEIDARARRVEHDSTAFAPDPTYPAEYDFEAQLAIYGDKHLNPTQRPLLELGRDLYDRGPLSRSGTWLGAHNPTTPQLMLYGDFRATGAYNDLGGDPSDAGLEDADDGTRGIASGRLTLDFDLRITATERIHATVRPFDEDGRFTRLELSGFPEAGEGEEDSAFRDELDFNADALFFEGDLGAMLGGLTGRDAPFDMPIAGGLMPLLFHNGIWVEDAFTGGAFTIPSRNSESLDWSNFDITFFAGFDRLSNPLFGVDDAKSHGRIFGTNWFIEAYRGYIEAGYAYVDDEELPGNDFHSVGLSFTKRWADVLSWSLRYMGTIGIESEADADLPDFEPLALADGHLFLLETSFITSRPYTFLPYFNAFASVDRPVSAARDPGAGGILKNTGLNFEADALTGFPSLNPNPPSSVGGALGLQMLGSNFGYQLVLEVAGIYPYETAGDDPSDPFDFLELPGEQYAFGARLQKPLTNALIFRMDGMYGKRKDLEDISGVRLELRYKF